MKKYKLYLFPLIVALLLIPMGIVRAQTDSTDYEIPTNIETTFDLNTKDDSDMEEVSIMEIIIGSFFYIGLYVYASIAYFKIAKELGYKRPWYAWVPLLNFGMILELGGKSIWLILLIMIPFVGIFILLLMYILSLGKIAEKRGYDKLLAWIVLTGIGNIILLYLLAWKPKNIQAQTPPNSNANLQQNSQSPTPELPLEKHIEQETTARLDQQSPQAQQPPQNPRQGGN